MGGKDVFITTEITNEAIFEKLEEMHKVQIGILEQATKTNGRVTKLEARSIGNWIANHPFKTVAVFIMAFSLNEAGQSVWKFLASLLI